jgi:outer membrane lipoprotein-sorting protein
MRNGVFIFVILLIIFLSLAAQVAEESIAVESSSLENFSHKMYMSMKE